MAARKYTTDLTADYVRSILDYDPETGIFRWKWRNDVAKQSWNTRYAGTVVGSLRNGYIIAKINYRDYSAHRIAWLVTHGVWPPDELDHINGNKADNRISNLRLATRQQNMCNTKIWNTSSTGVKGVCWRKEYKKYCARVTIDSKRTHLGYFDTIAEAAAARAAAEIKYFGEFRNQNAAPAAPASLCSARTAYPLPAACPGTSTS
jgi:hypothetical protein